MRQRPTEAEYAPFYADYVARVPEGDVLAPLAEQPSILRSLAARIPRERETYAYAPGKWTIRQVFGHLADGERVFGYRALCISRGDETPLPGFEEDAYVAAAPYDQTPLGDLAEEFAAVRQSNLLMFKQLGGKAWAAVGTANGTPISVRALSYIMVGHVRHHLGVLSERYSTR